MAGLRKKRFWVGTTRSLGFFFVGFAFIYTKVLLSFSQSDLPVFVAVGLQPTSAWGKKIVFGRCFDWTERGELCQKPLTFLLPCRQEKWQSFLCRHDRRIYLRELREEKNLPRASGSSWRTVSHTKPHSGRKAWVLVWNIIHSYFPLQQRSACRRRANQLLKVTMWCQKQIKQSQKFVRFRFALKTPDGSWQLGWDQAPTLVFLNHSRPGPRIHAARRQCPSRTFQIAKS